MAAKPPAVAPRHLTPTVAVAGVRVLGSCMPFSREEVAPTGSVLSESTTGIEVCASEVEMLLRGVWKPVTADKDDTEAAGAGGILDGGMSNSRCGYT